MANDKQIENMSVSDILKSIRGIIDNHDVKKVKLDEDVLELTNVVDMKNNKSPTKNGNIVTKTPVINDKISFFNHNKQSVAQSNNNATPDTSTNNLLSETAAQTISSEINEFVQKAQTVAENKIMQEETAAHSGAGAIESFMIELIKPELKRWLDENLPSLVKKIIEKEIKNLVTNKK